MNEAVVDIEGNELLDKITVVHCMSIRDANTGELIKSCADQPGYPSVAEGLETLDKMDVLIGHNLDGYDIPALKKVRGYTPKAEIKDTLVMARLAHSNLFELEINSGKKVEELGYKHGSHSLKAYGVRLGELKGDLQEDDKENAFETWTPEMQTYMDQDTKVNWVLYQNLQEKNLAAKALEIEHKFNRIMQQQMLNGIQFDKDKAKILADELKHDVSKIQQWVKDNIQPKVIKLKTKEKTVPFNIGSTDQVAEYFTAKYGWQPSAWTKKNNIKLDGDTLASLPYPEAKIFRDYNDRVKILGFLTEGDNAWMKAVKEDGRIYGYVNSNGQITGRIKMSNPNLGQIPAKGVYKGEECRSLFTARPGYSLVDCDAAGIQLRMLGHYLVQYDGGAYANEIIQGDIHTKNQEAAGLLTRPQAKEFIYAFLFGAGQAKLGSIALPEAREEVQRAEGKRLKDKFLAANPAINDLLWDCKRAFNAKGSIRSLDGRIVYPRGDYKTLNTLLQTAEAVLMKQANIYATERLILNGVDFFQVAFIHDEMLFEVKEGQEKIAGEIVKQSIKDAGEELNLKIPMDGEWKTGKSWDQTH